jgi:uncharacterized membrane protein YjfL (UPF0719 family)
LTAICQNAGRFVTGTPSYGLANQDGGAVARRELGDISLTVAIVSAIRASSDQLAQGLTDTLVFGLVGIVLQGVALAVLEAAVPGHYRNIIDADKFHPASIAAAVILLAVGGINAAALS